MGPVLGDTGTYEFRRAVRVRTPQGMGAKPCTRYAEEIAELLGHQCATTAPTPAVDDEEEKANGEVMDRHMAKTYRICVSKAWRLANYRLDVPRAARRLAQGLREPRHRDDQRLKRLGRYVKGTADHGLRRLHANGRGDR